MKLLKVVLGIAISAFFLWVVFRNIALSKIFEIISSANIFLVISSLAIGMVGFSIRCYRWKFIGYEKYKSIPWLSFFKATSMGLMLNTFVPMRGGDLFQAYTLSKRENISKSFALSTVFLERLVDLSLLIITLLISSTFVALPEQITLIRIIILVTLLIGALLIAVKYLHFFMKILKKFLAERHSAKIQGIIDNFISSAALLRRRDIFIKVALLTIVSWFLSGAATYILLQSLKIPIPFLGSYFVQAGTLISVAIPSSPGYIGTWEFFCVLALGVFGIKGAQALGFALLFHFMALLPTTVLGLYFLFIEVISRSKKTSHQP